MSDRTRPKPESRRSRPSADVERLAAMLVALTKRIPDWQTKDFARRVNANVTKKFGDVYKWFRPPGSSGFRAPPAQPEVGQAIIVALAEMGAWNQVDDEVRQKEIDQVSSYFVDDPQKDVSDNEMVGDRTAAVIQEIRRRRNPVSTAKKLFEGATTNLPAIFCVIPEADLSAATNPSLMEAIKQFVCSGGCYVAIVPSGEPAWPRSDAEDERTDASYELVSSWREIYRSAQTVVQKLRHRLTNDCGADTVDRVQLVVPNFDGDSNEDLRCRLAQWLPPTLGPAARPWLLFAGAAYLDDLLAYTCGVQESTEDGRVWTKLSVISPDLSTYLLGADDLSSWGIAKFPREFHVLRNYCYEILRQWHESGRTHVKPFTGTAWRCASIE